MSTDFRKENRWFAKKLFIATKLIYSNIQVLTRAGTKFTQNTD